MPRLRPRTPWLSSAATLLPAAALALASGCGLFDQGPEGTAVPVATTPVPRPPAEPDAVTLSLGSDVPFATLDLPPHARPHLPAPPERIPLVGWSRKNAGFQAPLPVRTRNFYFIRPPAGMRVQQADGTEVVAQYFRTKEAVSWSYDATTLDVRGPLPAPDDDDLFLVWPTATTREAGLNLATSGLEPAAFSVRTVQAGPVSRTGLLLPAPAVATFDLTVPPRAMLRFSPALVVPEVADAPPSDGAEVVVSLTVAGSATEVWRGRVDGPTFRPVRVDLAAYAGQQATLRIETLPGAHNRFDYVFLADPVVATEKAQPRRAVVVFVDTLRPDHLSAYGYERATSPAIAAISASGVRFDEARSIAPWTLPSARTMVTGRDPEHFYASTTLQHHLGKAGWATAMFAGNLYLGSNFGLDRDWGLHDVELLPRARSQVDKAIAWLEEEQGRDAFMLLHLMDAHLPYKEPERYRTMFAGPRPASLDADEFHRPQVVGKVRSEEDRQYIRDRYDQSIRYLDDELARLFASLSPSDVVVLVSDHGEEFWEHGGYEHGHALFDELLRVPFIVRAPELQPGTVLNAPVSLLDLAPTVLDLLDVEADGMQGVSLVPAMEGSEEAVQGLRERDLAFGRPLYGRERWGALHEGTKWTAISARESIFDLSADPGEKKDLAKGEAGLKQAGRSWLAEALGREVAIAYRVANRATRAPPAEDLVLTITVPGGVRRAWVGDDPTEASLATVTVEGEQLVATWPARWRGSRDVWFVPNAPLAEVTHAMKIVGAEGSVQKELAIDASKPATLPATPELLLRGDVGERGFELGFGITPLPVEGARALSGFDASLRAELEAMGYVVGE